MTGTAAVLAALAVLVQPPSSTMSLFKKIFMSGTVQNRTVPLWQLWQLWQPDPVLRAADAPRLL
ncbi:hypothetical protein ACI2K4_12965 [Micromonospora sp. NPDC050397]|uniref:hypothetical protein n=1 Tax=Micromonospora sp. NPDC050397 TaxID=3364279 RepID=UPI00385066EB